jgi:flagellar basal-body rod protein FlgF
VQLGVQISRLELQPVSTPDRDNNLAMNPERHICVASVRTRQTATPWFNSSAINGGWIASASGEDSNSVDPLLVAAASGMKTRMESLDMLANNLANAGTTGFKSDREFSNLYEEALPMVQSQWTDFSQGMLTVTGNPLNVALSGKGLFALNSTAGTVYTRNGEFRISKSNQLETAEGYTIRNVQDQGRPISVDPLQPVVINKNGTVSQGGQDLGIIEVSAVDVPNTLSKMGNSYFTPLDKAAPAPTAQAVDLLQGQLEQSNAAPADFAVKLISVMRQFEMLQKAMTLGTQMNQSAIQEVAKVS